MKRIAWLVLAALVVAPASAQAQRWRHREPAREYGNRFSLEPFAGAYNDAFDNGGGSDTSPLFGLRLGYRLGDRMRLIATGAYNRTDDVVSSAGLSDFFVYDNTWVLTTGGLEFDVVPGRTSASLGVQAGAAWRQVDVDGRVGSPTGTPVLESDGFSAHDVIVPGISLRYHLTSRAALALTAQDYMLDVFDGPTDHSPALTLGVAFR